MIELRCSRDLALRLGAVAPDNVMHHRHMAGRKDVMLVRDRETGFAMFWLKVPMFSDAQVRDRINRLIGKSS